MTKSCDPNIIPENCSVSDLVECGIDTETTVIDTSGTSIEAPALPEVLRAFPIKVPRFLKRVVISGCIKSTINIPGYFSEIKDIRKKVIITQSKLICDELIVEGYILKDIKYVRPQSGVTNANLCLAYPNCWFDISEKVPFTLCMTVTGLPANIYPVPNTNQASEFNYLCDTMSQQCCDKGYMAPSPCETLRVETNYLNERPYAELVGYRIAELDFNNHRCPCPPAANNGFSSPCDCLYDSLTEKIKLDIVLDLYVLAIAQATVMLV
jgi:hypothetical protein